jgi:hypothetical protein
MSYTLLESTKKNALYLVKEREREYLERVSNRNNSEKEIVSVL